MIRSDEGHTVKGAGSEQVMPNFSAVQSVLVRKVFDHNLTGGAGVSHSATSAEWGSGFLYKITDLNVEFEHMAL